MQSKRFLFSGSIRLSQEADRRYAGWKRAGRDTFYDADGEVVYIASSLNQLRGHFVERVYLGVGFDEHVPFHERMELFDMCIERNIKSVDIARKEEPKIGPRTLKEWREFARRDDCLERMVPSDLRQILAVIPG